MVAISYALFFLQAFAVFGSFLQDKQNNQTLGTDLLSYFRMPTSAMDLVAVIGTIVGYFLPTIIGIILLAIAHKRKLKQKGLYKEPRRHSLFGIIVCIAALYGTLFVWVAVEQLEQSTEYWAYYVINSYQRFRVYVAISAILCLFAFFARRQWCYIFGAVVLSLGLFLYAKNIAVVEEYVILVALEVIAFIFDRNMQKKQVEVTSQASQKEYAEAEISYTADDRVKTIQETRKNLNTAIKTSDDGRYDVISKETDKELYICLQKTFYVFAKKIIPTFMESIIKKEPVDNPSVDNPSNKLDLSADDISWVTASIVELTCFLDAIYRFIVLHYISEHYTITQNDLRTFSSIDAEIRQSINELQLTDIIAEREETYINLWNASTTIEQAKEIIVSYFSYYCSFAYTHEKMGTEIEVAKERSIYRNLQYFQLIHSISLRVFEQCDVCILETIKKYWKGKNLCQYCGNHFIGTETKICSVCGRKKDY